MSENCIFCRIARGELPSQPVYQDDEVIAFRDIKPAAPTHLLIVPREHIDSLMTAEPRHQALLGKMLLLAPRLIREQGIDDGFRLVINSGTGGGQEVFHIHFHVMAGARPWRQFP
jgi:histidine triad (HIT) family protein